MPRPKRTKIGPSNPANRNAQLRAKLIDPKDVVEDISDDEEERERAVKPSRRFHDGNKQPTVENPQNVVQDKITKDSNQVWALAGMNKRRDAAIRRLEAENNTSTEQVVSSNDQGSSSPAIEIGRRAITTPAAENSLLAFGNFRRRTRQPSILGRKESKARSSSVESDLAESHGLANVPVEGSVLARGTFKRRPRQPSILGRGPSRVRSSSIGLEMDRNTPGNEKSPKRSETSRRRSRQVSVLGNDVKDQRLGLESDYNDEDDFNPDDESTPLNLSKTRQTDSRESQSVPSTSNPRKRKLSSLHPAESSPPAQADVTDPSSPILSTCNSPRPTVEDITRRRTPDLLSDTMAPPMSSSSPRQDSPELRLPSGRNNAHQRGRSIKRQPIRKPLAPPRDESLPSSPPSLTHSPNRLDSPARRRIASPRLRKQPGNLSTMQLQALLPRRRRHQARDTFEIESSDDAVDASALGSDDDELTHLTTRTNRTTRSTRAHSIARLKPGPSIKGKSKPTPTPTTAAYAKASVATASAPQTYRSRHTLSDKENESGDPFTEDHAIDPHDSLAPVRDAPSPEDSQELERRVGKELKTAKRKFEVVDKWELEFEDVTAESSSPWDAR